jgi:ABC-type uncharacterized transport system substrate-binding protein
LAARRARAAAEDVPHRYLDAGERADPVQQNLRRQFLLGLRDLGYVEDRNFKMDDRNADGQLDRLSPQAVELVRAGVDIIVAGGEAPIRAARQATDRIPIVMAIRATNRKSRNGATRRPPHKPWG